MSNFYAMIFECAMCTIFDSSAVFPGCQCSAFSVHVRVLYSRSMLSNGQPKVTAALLLFLCEDLGKTLLPRMRGPRGKCVLEYYIFILLYLWSVCLVFNV